jgi:hypothetical protein
VTRDEIEKAAFEAGLLYSTGKFVCGPPLDNLEKFANLIAAAECEACAKVCDDIGADDCAAAIRARGES